MNTEILGLIPARGGSKGIPQKNLASLYGRPLLAYTCEAALASRRLTRVVLNTDDPTIADAGRTMGVEVPYLRPSELGRDETPVIDVVLHALAWFKESEGYRPEAVVLLQPTSPLRRVEHIDAAIDILLDTGADSVVSVVQVPHQFHPVSLMKMEDGRLLQLQSGYLPARRQDKPRLYARNGPAVLAVTTSVLLEQHSLYGEDCRPLAMGLAESVDVDGPADLLFAEFLLGRCAGGPAALPAQERARERSNLSGSRA